MDIFKKAAPLLIVLFLSLPVIWPLFQNGYFPMHDDTQPTRVYEMYRALSDGQFPVRIARDLGYGLGYPIFNYYSPLPYYIGAFFMFLGLDAIWAAKMMMGMGLILSGVTMYMLGKALWEKNIAVFITLLYVYAPYHAIQVFVRGAVGELYAYAFLPLIVFGCVHAYKNKIAGVLVGSVGIFGIIVSHNISALLLVFLTLVGYPLVLFFSKKRFEMIKTTCFMWVLGLGLSAFFWLPALVEVSYTRINELTSGNNDFRQHFVYMDQLWNSPWGFAGSTAGRLDGMSFMLGKIHIVLFLTVLIFSFIKFKKVSSTQKNIFMGSTLLVVTSIFFMLHLSQPVWEVLPFMAFIQYPWRFLMFAVFGMSILGGSIVTFFSKAQQKWVLPLIIFFVVGFNLRYFKPQFPEFFDSERYTKTENIRWNISRISDEYLSKNMVLPKFATEVLSDDFETSDAIIVEQFESFSHFKKAKVSAESPAELIFLVSDFPKWLAVLDTQKVPTFRSGNELRVQVPPGVHTVTLYLENTWIRSVANSSTVVFSVIFTYYLWKLLNNKKHEPGS